MLLWCASSASAACLLVKDLDALSGADGADATTDDDGAPGPGADGGTSSSSSSSGSGGVPDADVPDSGPCPTTTRGPMLVPTPLGFCVDATEVTVQQYRAFLTDVNGVVSGQEPRCADNATFNPTPGLPDESRDSYPVANVDFCDAVAFCTWSGKHICRGRDGSSLGPLSRNVAAESQWYAACSSNADGLHKYPYGNSVDPSACNGQDRTDAARALLPVKRLSTCVGGYPGLFDLAGNVYEWDDLCATDDAGATSCEARGGSYQNSAVNLRCDHAGVYDSTTHDETIGIRCCAL